MEENVNVPSVTYEDERGRTVVITSLNASMKEQLDAAGIDTTPIDQDRSGEPLLASHTRWPEGQIIYPGMRIGFSDQKFRTPRLSIPQDYYTQNEWSHEFYNSEPLVYSLVNRDIDQAISDEEFQMPEEREKESGVLQKWRGILNKPLGQHGGLSEYNRGLALESMLGGLVITYANWGPISKDGTIFEMPVNFVNLSARALVPDIDSFTGKRRYYYKLTPTQLEDIRRTRKNTVNKPGIMQIIPDAKERIVTDLKFVADKLDPEILGHSANWMMSTGNGAWLDLPLDDAYIINYRGLQHERWPVPSLVPIFPAIAMKRKLQMANWAVADGMINMIVVFTFPEGVGSTEGQGYVSRFTQGGRVQAHALPYNTDIKIVTPDTDLLNSSEQFWMPTSEIMAHFGYPLNSKSRGAGDLDSGPLDTATNKARLVILRETIEDHNNFFLRQVSERNNWDFDVWAILQTRDLDDSDSFRTFATTLYDRGLLSIKTMLALANTSMEREKARREKESREKLDELFEIRPSFSQAATGLPGDGRPPKASSPSSATTGDKGQGKSRSSRARPATTAKVTSS